MTIPDQLQPRRIQMHNFEAEIWRDQPALPPIKITEDESRRLSSLANSTMDLFPRVAQFLARELDRATVGRERLVRRGQDGLQSDLSR